jgi:hypothetical protein
MAMKVVLKHLVRGFINHRRQEGMSVAFKRLGMACRVALFPAHQRELFALPLYRHYLARQGGLNGLVHFSLPHYLSRNLSLTERAACALLHFRHESAQYDDRYQHAVYLERGPRRGITLWSSHVDGVEYSIRLRASNTDIGRCEGPLCVALCVDSVCITEVGFSWVDSRIFGASLGIVPFVTKNQSVKKDSQKLQLFRKTFAQNSPPYFCIAALRGIAQVHRVAGIATVRHDCQFSYREGLASGFLSSYCKFWQALGAEPLDAQSLLIPVTLAAPPLEALPARHRGRASSRRAHWQEISRCAGDSISRYRRDLPAAH